MADLSHTSTANWVGIGVATGLLLLFFLFYYGLPDWLKRMQRRSHGAAPDMSSRSLGGRPWWPRRFQPLPVFVISVYFGTVCLCIDSFWAGIASIWWYVWAVVVAVFFWIWPAYVSSLEATFNRKEKRRKMQDTATGFPEGDEADFRVVSPYAPVDSGRKPWWRPRRRGDSVNDSLA